MSAPLSAVRDVAAPPLRVETVSSAEGIEAHRGAMEACVAATGADVYFTPDWLIAWFATCGRHGRPFVVLGFAGERIEAMLPCLVETLWLGPLPVRVARLAGTDPSYPVMGLPLPTDAGAAAAFLAAAFAALTAGPGTHALSLSPLSARAGGGEAIRAAAEAAAFVVANEDWSRRHTVMDLPDSFDVWFASLSKNRRREYAKSRAALEAMGPLATRTATPETAPARLEVFADLHGRQWRAIGKAGHFGDWPEALPLARAVMPRLAPSGRSRIDEQWCGETLLSSRMTLRQGRRAYWRLVGRTLDAELVRLGVGRVGLVDRVRDLIAEGVREIEAGVGEYDYKLAFRGELVPAGRVVLAAPGAGWRVRLLLAASDLLNLFYYRGWFLKLRPRLGLAPRPLWRLWRRTRL